MSAIDEGCAFCAIAAGADSSVEVLAHDERWVAFFPLEPATPGHTLVIPRAHASDVWDLDPLEASHLMAGVIRIGRAIERALEPEGMNLISSAGVAAEQSVFHVHLHVVPRWRRDGFGPIWPGDQRFHDPDLEELADGIRSALE